MKNQFILTALFCGFSIVAMGQTNLDKEEGAKKTFKIKVKEEGEVGKVKNKKEIWFCTLNCLSSFKFIN